MAADLLLVLPFVFLGAALYSSVGHGGATVYLAILTLAGFAVDPLATTVLVLNVMAAGIALVVFHRSGHLRMGLLLPFLVASVPLAYLGGAVAVSSRVQEIVLGVALLAAALRFLLVRDPPRVPVPREGAAFRFGAPVLGGILGFLSGIVGIGGGIFLSPILVVLGWADVREAGAIAAAFIVVNSLAGLASRLQRTPLDATLLLAMGVVVVAGALLGSFLGARRLPPRALQALLGAVLLVASVKSLFV